MTLTKAELADLLFEKVGLPFAPINRPEDMFEDPHLNHPGAMLPITLPAASPIAPSKRSQNDDICSQAKSKIMEKLDQNYPEKARRAGLW